MPFTDIVDTIEEDYFDYNYARNKTGWYLSDELVPSPYIKCRKTAAHALCAEFRYYVDKNGSLELSPSHSGTYLALTKEELKSPQICSLKGIHSVKLREAALAKFAEQPVVIVQDNTPQVRTVQMAAAEPEPTFNMKG